MARLVLIGVLAVSGLMACQGNQGAMAPSDMSAGDIAEPTSGF